VHEVSEMVSDTAGPDTTGPGAVALTASDAWDLLLALAARAKRGDPLLVRTVFCEGRVAIDPAAEAMVHAPPGEARTLLELMLPLVVGARAAALVVGHLGQSLDGRVATPTGASKFITGHEDIVHTHRLRALFDAVVVGVRTVQLDDPQLTTRHVTGAHPTRVVLDPQRKLCAGFKVLEDGSAPTLVVTSLQTTPTPRRVGAVEWVGLPCVDGRFALDQLCGLLAARGLSRVFVEGGGVTVSRFLAARALDRLHVSVAPLILGSGAPAFKLPEIDKLDEALGLRCRHFALGPDVLFDCELTPPPVEAQ
jgi:diaminohydroxyphosphoribosylaminopyrimidine deaminase/5-amino-6-(5-phosphoribosylamino)uracil reductase